MNFPICKDTMVLTQATNFGEKYKYCRTCKKEMKEILALKSNNAPHILKKFSPVLATRPACHSAVLGSEQQHEYGDITDTTCICGKLEFRDGSWFERTVEPEHNLVLTGLAAWLPTPNLSMVVHKYDPMTHNCICGTKGSYRRTMFGSLWSCDAEP
jgi:hypothetical protein